MHNYTARISWTGSTADYTSYSRAHDVLFDGKPRLRCSADPMFRGDAGMHNPEDLFLAAVAGCHMLSYLSLCARRGVRVLSYTDEARGTLAIEPAGGGRFTDVLLSPVVIVDDEADASVALSLHEEAHARCFIANSCAVPIRCVATIEKRTGERAPQGALA